MDTNTPTPLEEITEMLNETDEKILSETERAAIIAEISSHGISIPMRARLADICHQQLARIDTDAAENEKLIGEVNAEIDADPDTKDAAEAAQVVAEESAGLDFYVLEFRGKVEHIAGDFDRAAETSAEAENRAKIEQLEADLRNKPGTGNTAA